MKRLFISAVILLACVTAFFAAVYAIVKMNIPDYKDSVGDVNYTEKITGLYLVEQSAARGDLIIYGSSELRTTEISTHPANFFAGKRGGFQVNLVGRGSCQSLVHAISIAAAGNALAGKRVVLITSPQSYVEDGIAPDLFMANFSAQQYMELIRDPVLSDEVKRYISSRVQTLTDSYRKMPDAAYVDTGIRYLAEHESAPSVASTLRNIILSPYNAFILVLHDLKDMTAAENLIESAKDYPAVAGAEEIDWASEERAALLEAERMTANNGFGMLDDYYTTYIGTRLQKQENKDQGLSYSASREYDDLRVLFEVCRQKGVEPLFVHVPLHGEWSDYTGFVRGRREEYYENVRQIAAEYDVKLLDLTGYEYEKYFLCDVMHLGWKGWLEVDKAIVGHYYGD